MKLSIVIPVYNVENYLRRCIDSVVPQLSCEHEVILIDDGSTDMSPQICDEYVKKNDRFSVIHQENQGLSSARNVGIENSEGEYVLFLDSDDWIAEDSLRHICKAIDSYSPDLILGKALLVDEDGTKKPKINYYIPEGLYSIHDYLDKLKEKMEFSPCAPFTIYKRSFLENNNLRFKVGILHEDILWTSKVLLHAKNVYCMDYYFYLNYIRQGSITHSGNSLRSGKDIITVCNELRNEFQMAPADLNIEALKDSVARKYMEATTMLGNPVKGSERFSSKELLHYSYFRRTRKKAMLYALSPHLYIFLAKHI